MTLCPDMYSDFILTIVVCCTETLIRYHKFVARFSLFCFTSKNFAWIPGEQEWFYVCYGQSELLFWPVVNSMFANYSQAINHFTRYQALQIAMVNSKKWTGCTKKSFDSFLEARAPQVLVSTINCNNSVCLFVWGYVHYFYQLVSALADHETTAQSVSVQYMCTHNKNSAVAP